MHPTSCIGKGNGKPLQCSCLENPRDRGASWAAVYGVAQSRTWLKRLSSSSSNAPNLGAPQYIRQTLIDKNGEIYNNTIILGDFNTPLTPMARSSKQKICKETQDLNDTLDKMDLIDIFRKFHPDAEYTFFSCVHGTFSRIDHILSHRSNLSKFKKIEIVSRIFSSTILWE